ncbi:MCE family protein [Saccharomonospora iraqiensis]|uniref:MCE family protein n=1 Tax=Saccharomonospora iraqiensis TaxID=52698 RepID=UPI00041C6008|nr:MCE family protein [Saccharomonospora iraqiensis]
MTQATHAPGPEPARPRPRRRLRRLAAALGVTLLVAGCADGGFSGLYTAPLPGGADLGDDPYRVTVEFRDVLDLVPQASVKVDDVAVGRVERITLAEDTKSAEVELAINGGIALPANADAELRQSSLLGEKFVELSPPSAGEEPAGRLSDGATIPLARTERHAQVEEVLGALSLLLNGGGVEQLREIVRELNTALTGNEAEFRALLSRADHLATELDGQRGEIVRAIEGVNDLATTLDEQSDDLTLALDHLEPGLAVVDDQRDQLVGMLGSLDELSGVGSRVIEATRDDLAANLASAAPVLEKLAETGPDLAEALKLLPTYPIPAFGHRIVHGDYANVGVRLDLNLDSVLENILGAYLPAEAGGPTDASDGPDTAGTGGESGDGTDASVPPLPLPGTAEPDTGSRDEAGGDVGGLLGGLLGGTR